MARGLFSDAYGLLRRQIKNVGGYTGFNSSKDILGPRTKYLQTQYRGITSPPLGQQSTSRLRRSMENVENIRRINRQIIQARSGSSHKRRR